MAAVFITINLFPHFYKDNQLYDICKLKMINYDIKKP